MIPWTAAYQAPLSMGFPRQKFWSRLPFPSSGDLPYPGIEPWSPALAGEFFTTDPAEKPTITFRKNKKLDICSTLAWKIPWVEEPDKL